MRIRAFTTDDLLAARELWGSAEGMRPPPRAEIVRKLERDAELFFVAEADDELVGVVMGTYDGRRGWIFRLAVEPTHRRRRVRCRARLVRRRPRGYGVPIDPDQVESACLISAQDGQSG